MKTRAQVIELLRSVGISPLESRVAVYSYLDAHRVHPTADVIYKALSPNYSTLSRTTVYNTLKLFAQAGLVRQLNIEDGELRYDANMDCHAHLKCQKCGRIIDVFDVNFPDKVNVNKNWCVNSCQVNFYGICPDCK